MNESKLFWKFKSDLRKCNTAIELLRFICKMLIEIWWNTNGHRDRD